MDLEDRIDIWDAVAKQAASPLDFIRLDFLHISQLTFQKTPFFLSPPPTLHTQTQAELQKKVCSWSDREPF